MTGSPGRLHGAGARQFESGGGSDSLLAVCLGEVVFSQVRYEVAPVPIEVVIPPGRWRGLVMCGVATDSPVCTMA